MPGPLKSVLGFRPTPEQIRTIEEAERATGRNRSDIMRKCYELALAVVVKAMIAEREAAYAAFNESLKDATLAEGPQHKEDHAPKPPHIAKYPRHKRSKPAA